MGVALSQAAHLRLDLVSALGFAAVAVVACALTYTRSAYGVAALVVADPFDVARYVGWTTVTVPKIVLVGVALGLIARRVSLSALADGNIRLLPIAASAIAIVTIATIFPGTYVDAVARESLKAMQYLATLCVATIAFAHDPDERLAWFALAGVTAIVCASALVQEATTAPAGVMLAGHVVPRVAGLLDGPNQLAGFLDIAIPLLLSRALDRGHAYLAIVALAFVVDVLTFSRAGVLAIVIGVIFVVARASDAGLRRATLAIGATFFAAIGITLARLGVWSRFLSTDDVDTASGLGSRSELWSAALGFWRTHPLLGIGAGNFELELPEAGLVGVRTHANSLYLQSLAEGGIALFAANAFAIVAAIRTFYVRAPRAALYIGIGAATIALATHQIFDTLTYYPKIGSFWWLWLGIASGSLVARTEART